MGFLGQEHAGGEQHPLELPEEPAGQPNAAVNKKAADTALCCSACSFINGTGIWARGRGQEGALPGRNCRSCESTEGDERGRRWVQTPHLPKREVLPAAAWCRREVGEEPFPW